MKKSEELQDPNSCWNRARDDEHVFPILDRDVTMPATIRFWTQERMRQGRNEYSDSQIQEALQLAKSIERERLGPDWFGPVVSDGNRQDILDQIVMSYILMPHSSRVAMCHALACDITQAGLDQDQAKMLQKLLEALDDHALGEIYFTIWDNAELTGAVIPGLPVPEPANDDSAAAPEGSGNDDEPIAA